MKWGQGLQLRFRVVPYQDILFWVLILLSMKMCLEKENEVGKKETHGWQEGGFEACKVRQENPVPARYHNVLAFDVSMTYLKQ